MAGAQQDINGNYLPYDDPDIPNISWVVRYLVPDYFVDCPRSPGGKRLSSGAFALSSTPNHGMSVDLGVKLEAAGMNALSRCQPEHGAAKLPVHAIRAAELMVGESPEADNAFHGEVWRKDGGKNFTSGTKRALHAAAEIVRRPG